MNCEAVAGHIVSWLNNYRHESGQKGFVVGVSGGIDSAVCSTLCALTGSSVICVNMPIHQKEDQLSRGLQHINELEDRFPNVTGITVDLTDQFESFKKNLPFTDGQVSREMSLANTRARLRMTTLYYYAAAHRYLVCGTGNKVEDFGVGFYTKYGDGGVDLSPIADLMKTEVFELGKHLEVNQAILDAPPTDGLWSDDRSDVDQIGATYPELEWAMREYEKGKKPEDFEGNERKVFKIFLHFHLQNQHKMNPIPVCNISESIKS